MLHKVQIKDQQPTEFHDVTLLAQTDTTFHDVDFILGDPQPTVFHDIEIQFIPTAAGGMEKTEPEIVAIGEIIEPEILIQTETQDILVERVHPAYILADDSPPDNPKLVTKSHMDSVVLTPNEVQQALPGVKIEGATAPQIKSVTKVPMKVSPSEPYPQYVPQLQQPQQLPPQPNYVHTNVDINQNVPHNGGIPVKNGQVHIGSKFQYTQAPGHPQNGGFAQKPPQMKPYSTTPSSPPRQQGQPQPQQQQQHQT